MTKYSYEIKRRHRRELGDGFRLKLLEDGQEVGGGVFPVPQHDHQKSIDWWNTLTEIERKAWIFRGNFRFSTENLINEDDLANVYYLYLLDEAHDDAFATAQEWLASRGEFNAIYYE